MCACTATTLKLSVVNRELPSFEIPTQIPQIGSYFRSIGEKNKLSDYRHNNSQESGMLIKIYFPLPWLWQGGLTITCAVQRNEDNPSSHLLYINMMEMQGIWRVSRKSIKSHSSVRSKLQMIKVDVKNNSDLGFPFTWTLDSEITFLQKKKRT